MEKQTGGLLNQLSHLLVPKRTPPTVTQTPTVTNEQILHALIGCFEASLARESIGTSLLFDAHYVIILHPTSYAERLAALPVIVNEAVNAFYDRISARRKPGDTVVTVASHWHFKFGPGTEFDGRSLTPADVEVIGSLTGASLTGASLDNDAPAGARRGPDLKATRKVKNTNVYDKLDLNLPAFDHIDFRESGAFAVRIDAARFGGAARPATAAAAPPSVVAGPQPARPVQPGALARLDCYVADQNTEETYWMNDREVVIARREPDNEPFANYIRLASPYVSNPHARIRYDATTGQFQLASFSRHETRLNEQIVARSEPSNPVWTELPDGAQVLLNGVVTLSFHRLA